MDTAYAAIDGGDKSKSGPRSLRYQPYRTFHNVLYGYKHL